MCAEFFSWLTRADRVPARFQRFPRFYVRVSIAAPVYVHQLPVTAVTPAVVGCVSLPSSGAEAPE